jgi:pimeloyl-ACP methyl ester carboxylesterase
LSLFPFASLLRWLGPWSGGAVPKDVHRDEVRIEGTQVRAYLYRPTRGRPLGAYLLAPGLHFLGPDDPRLDRFCRVLASSRLLVFSTFLPEYLALRLLPSVGDSLAAAFDRLEELARREALPRPAIFSISFGSVPALAVASRPSHRDRVGAVVIFGGFADFHAVSLFSLTGEVAEEGRVVHLERDPTSAPALFLNLLPHLGIPGDLSPLETAWMRMARRTWGRAELKRLCAMAPIGEEIARTLPEPLRLPFLIGCGLRAGGRERVLAALARAQEAFSFSDTRSVLSAVKAPLVIVHGRDDDVIPWHEAVKLARAVPRGHPHRLLLTGFYGHTGARLPARAVAEEARTLLALARDLPAAATGTLEIR